MWREMAFYREIFFYRRNVVVALKYSDTNRVLHTEFFLSKRFLRRL